MGATLNSQLPEDAGSRARFHARGAASGGSYGPMTRLTPRTARRPEEGRLRRQPRRGPRKGVSRAVVSLGDLKMDPRWGS